MLPGARFPSMPGQMQTAPPRALVTSPQAPTQPNFVAVQQAAQPRPKVRAVSADPAPPARLALPSPEELGIKTALSAPTPATAIDWNQIHARLDRLGIINFQRDRLPQGGFRVLVTLPAGRTPEQHFEATGATEAVAVLTALERAESVSGRR
jgi:hypothetical protein